MTSKFLNIDTDTTLAQNSDTTIASQKAIKSYVDTEIARHDSGKLNLSFLRKAKAWKYTQQISSGDLMVYDSTNLVSTLSSKSIVNTGYCNTGHSTGYFILLSGNELYYAYENNLTAITTETTCVQVKGGVALRQNGSLFSIIGSGPSKYMVTNDTSSSGMIFTDFTQGSSRVWGICNGAIYVINNNTISLLNSNRTWTRLLNLGADSSGYYLLASDEQNKLYLVSIKQTNTEIDTGISFTTSVIAKGGIIGPYYYSWVIDDGALYQVGASASSCLLLDNQETWIDCVNDASHSFAITSTGKLYRGNNGSAIEAVGTDTDWQGLGGGSREGFGALKGGNLYSLRSFGGLDFTPLTTSGYFTSVYGGYIRSNSTGFCGLTFGSTGTTGEIVHRVYTNFNPSIGDKTYSSYSPIEESSTITAVNTASVTDANYTYQRDSNNDNEFVTLNDEIKNKPITAGILLQMGS